MRLKKLPPYLVAEIDKKKKAAIAAGRDVINLGIGDPDQPTPEFIIQALERGARNASNHQYSLDEGKAAFRQAVARWYERRFRVKLDPDTEVHPLIGSKEGIAHLPLAVLNPGDVALVPEPCYPPYRSGTIFAGGEPVYFNLTADNGFLPDLDRIDPAAAKAARLMFINYPNNPTAAVATHELYERIVAFARKYDLIVCSDAAYSEVYFGEPPISFLEVPGAKDVAVEMHSLSKTFNMTGWRVGMAVGNKDVVAALRAVKSNLDSGVFGAIQDAAIAALDYEGDFVQKQNAMYRARRDALCDGLARLGLDVPRPQASFYVWIPVPGGMTSTAACNMLLDQCDVVATPGNGFGSPGEGYIRAALTVDVARIYEAVKRIKRAIGI
jgi:LL-diaminopimelate aminotransferase